MSTEIHSQSFPSQFKGGKFHGQGVYEWSNGAKYVGEHDLDQRTGFGTMIYPDGAEFSGIWENGVHVKFQNSPDEVATTTTAPPATTAATTVRPAVTTAAAEEATKGRRKKVMRKKKGRRRRPSEEEEEDEEAAPRPKRKKRRKQRKQRKSRAGNIRRRRPQ